LAAIVLAAVFCCVAQNGSSPVESGIAGVVLTQDGQLASGAKVCISVHQRKGSTIDCRVSTDKEGRFNVEQLKPGAYQVFAINEAEGYSIENQAQGQDVTITGEQPWPNVTIHQRARGGVLVGSVIDKMTGKRLNRAQIQYTSLDSNGSGGTAVIDGDFQIAVPADSNLLVVVMSEGYRGWVFTDPSNTSHPVLRLGAGERKRLEVELEPLASRTPAQ
jgi:hypothetical protein